MAGSPVATTPTRLMTFEEFEQLPDNPFGRYELRHGEPFDVAPPRKEHFLLQQKLRKLLQKAAGETGEVYTEAPFRALPKGEFRFADLGYMSGDGWSRTDPQGYFPGAPEMVIEIPSPSNSAAEMRDRKQVCLENGCIEFWVVDLDLKNVEVSNRDGHTIAYTPGQEIALFFGGRVAVDAIFA
jgi:Uma2 family endonuclease